MCYNMVHRQLRGQYSVGGPALADLNRGEGGRSGRREE